MERAYKISHRIGKLLLIISLILIALLFLGTFVGIQTTTFAGPIAVTLILSLLLLAAPFFLKKILRD